MHYLVIFQPIAAVVACEHPLTPCQNSLPGNFHQGTAFTRASTVDHTLEKLFKYLTQCARNAPVQDFPTRGPQKAENPSPLWGCEKAGSCSHLYFSPVSLVRLGAFLGEVIWDYS